MTAKRRFRIVLETPEGPFPIDCEDDEHIWNAAARVGLRLPAICHQGRCLTCAGRVLQGSFDQTDADSYFAEDRAAGFILLCPAKPRSDLWIATHEEDEMRRRRRTRGLPAPYA